MATKFSEHNDKAQKNNDAKRSQSLLLFTFVISVLIVGFGFAWLTQKRAVQSTTETSPQISLPAEQIQAGELWRTSAQREIQGLQDSWNSLADRMNTMQTQLDSVATEINLSKAETEETEFERELLDFINMESQQAKITPLDVTSAVIPPIPTQQIKIVRVASLQNDIGQQLATGLDFVADDLELPLDQLGPSSPSEPPRPQDSEDYLPSGSFMPAIILGGIDAPTGLISKDNPHPVLLRIDKQARLPNLIRKDLRECFVLAAGYGDIASERALIRTERLSCKKLEGGYLDTQLRGFIVGEDGRAGVRGKLVTKQGQILQRSLLAGIGAGLSEIITTQRSDQIRVATTPNDNVQIPSLSLDSYAVAGLGRGLSSSLDRLSNYYISLAERIYPVIEVGAGRTVDIVVQEGLSLR